MNNTGPLDALQFSGAYDVRRAAITASASGISIWPVREDGSKRPIGAWKQGQSTRANLERVTSWYGSGATPKRAALGIITGRISGNLECLEFDAGGAAYEPFKSKAAE